MQLCFKWALLENIDYYVYIRKYLIKYFWFSPGIFEIYIILHFFIAAIIPNIQYI